MISGARRIKDLIRNQAKGDSSKAQMLFRHFAMERLLERLSVSAYSGDFIIKGDMLISSLIGVEERMTRDIDATMRGHDLSPGNAARILGEVAGIDIGDGYRQALRDRFLCRVFSDPDGRFILKGGRW